MMTKRSLGKINIRFMLRLIAGMALATGVALFSLLIAPPIHAQSPAVPEWQTAAGGKMTFEVASVRLSPPDAPPKGKDFLIPFDVPPPKGGYLSANVHLFNYIGFAYKILDTSQYLPLMAHLPKWAQTDQFDIEARAEGSPTTDQFRLMMQSLLVERFKLAIHTEIQQRPVYALVLDKPGKLGPQLLPHPDNVPCTDKPDKPELGDSGAPPYCGIAAWRINGRLHDRMINVPMDQIASFLGGSAGFVGGRDPRPIVDQTGLKGKFDLNIEFVKDAGGLSTEIGSEADASGATFTGALKNQLGLKLVKQTAPVPVYVIDHVEMPSEN
jgi:uncharacterized protein (TIGR03435 family)